MNVETRIAASSDLKELVSLVGQYHLFESINSTAQEREAALVPLVTGNAETGFIAVAEANETMVGYVAVCYGYTIEFGGRDAFVDEFYVTEAMRGAGAGSELIKLAKKEARKSGVLALHLEVSTDNVLAKRLYKRLGFQERDRFHLMSCRI